LVKNFEGRLRVGHTKRALLGAVLLSAVAATTAHAATSVYGSIGGVVTYASNHRPVGNVVVSAYQGRTLVATTTTATNGAYTMPDLSGGIYKVYFYPASGNGEATWYKNEPNVVDAVPVTVAAGRRTAGISQSLLTGATISGKITRPAGAAMTRVRVELFAVTSDSLHPYSSTSAETGSPYRLSAVPAGDYLVEFQSAGHAAWYAGPGKRSVGPRRLATTLKLTTSSRATNINGNP
jgi:hypothetical protein